MIDNTVLPHHLAAEGFRVFPLVPDLKVPAVPGWQAFASADVERTTHRWSQRFANHNWAIATGNGLLVLDFDCKADRPGLQSLEMLDLMGLPESRRVVTPSGGVHVYLSVPDDTGLSVSVDPLADDFPGLDVRCDGGYVAAPGSTVGGAPYLWLDSARPIEPAPPWLLDTLKRSSARTRKRPDDDLPALELDTPDQIRRATHYLVHNAPEAVEGAGGDQTTYEVAARCRDFGVSEAVAFTIMSEHWNEAGKASPPWMPEDLERKIANAYQYATGRAGRMAGLAEFEPADVIPGAPGEGDALANFEMEWMWPFDPAAIPKRAWVLGTFLARGYVAGLVAPPGAGKTTLELTMAVSLASGKPIAGFPVHERTRVFVWNQEDELDELRRRLAAILKAFHLDFDDIMIDGQPAILLGSGADNALLLARRDVAGRVVRSKEAKALTEMFLSRGVGAAMFDPLVELHQADENSNVEVGAVGRVLREIAVRAHTAVLIVHHTRKPPSGDASGHAGNMDSARGAGALAGVTRMGATLYGLDDRTARVFGVGEKERHRYVRLDVAKGNMSLAAGGPAFFRREGVNIGTFENPEDVGVLRPVTLEKALTTEEADARALAGDMACIVGEPGNRVALPDMARALVAGDSIVYGSDHRLLAKKICRRFDRGLLPGFIWIKGSKNEPGTVEMVENTDGAETTT